MVFFNVFVVSRGSGRGLGLGLGDTAGEGPTLGGALFAESTSRDMRVKERFWQLETARLRDRLLQDLGVTA